jgi:hypothetical protein
MVADDGDGRRLLKTTRRQGGPSAPVRRKSQEKTSQWVRDMSLKAREGMTVEKGIIHKGGTSRDVVYRKYDRPTPKGSPDSITKNAGKNILAQTFADFKAPRNLGDSRYEDIRALARKRAAAKKRA